MTLPLGQISMSQVNVELGLSATAQLDMNNAALRSLAGVPSGQISMSNLQGKSGGLTLVQNVSGTSSLVYPTIQQKDIVLVQSKYFAVGTRTQPPGLPAAWTNGVQILQRQGITQFSSQLVAAFRVRTYFIAGTAALTGTTVQATANQGSSVLVFRGLTTTPAVTLLGTEVAGTSYSQTINFSGTTPCINGLAVACGLSSPTNYPPGVTFGGAGATMHPPGPTTLATNALSAIGLEVLPAVPSSKVVATTGPANSSFRAFVIR